MSMRSSDLSGIIRYAKLSAENSPSVRPAWMFLQRPDTSITIDAFRGRRYPSITMSKNNTTRARTDFRLSLIERYFRGEFFLRDPPFRDARCGQGVY
jgi:hypothetical protein